VLRQQYRNTPRGICSAEKVTHGSSTLTEHEITEMCSILSDHIVPLMEEFQNECRNTSPMLKLWNDYLTQISTPLKLFISSTRSPNWTVQQFAKLQLRPLFSAANRNIYAKYINVQVLHLNRIPAEVEMVLLMECTQLIRLAGNSAMSGWIIH